MTVVGLALLAAVAGTGGGAPPVIALAEHLGRHPEAEAVDLYKLLHQSVFGPGHLIPDREAAARFLAAELGAMGEAAGDEPLCEPIGGAPPVVRLHLRPFRAAGQSPDALVDALVTSAGEIDGRPEAMTAQVAAVVAWLSAAGHDRLAAELERLGRELAAEGYPARHHSEAFRAAYRPAYRVVLRSLAVERGWCPP